MSVIDFDQCPPRQNERRFDHKPVSLQLPLSLLRGVKVAVGDATGGGPQIQARERLVWREEIREDFVAALEQHGRCLALRQQICNPETSTEDVVRNFSTLTWEAAAVVHSMKGNVIKASCI